MDVLNQDANSCLFDDGARTSWEKHLICTCLTARRQSVERNCCKHTVYAIRTRSDILLPDMWHPIPVVLTDEDGASAWVKVKRENGKLYAWLESFVLISADVEHRLDIRNLVVPYLLGLASKVTCTECAVEASWTETMLIRRTCHWLEDQTRTRCFVHDDSDLIPQI